MDIQIGDRFTFIDEEDRLGSRESSDDAPRRQEPAGAGSTD
jgi:hypothetical protein